MDGIDIMEAMRDRHSVRRYTDRRIEEPVKSLLQETIDACNSESNLRFQLFTDSPGAFDGILSAGFQNVRNYVALVKKTSESDEKVGYYGEEVVLRAQQLGLRTCWVGLSYSKKKCKAEVADDEKLACMLAIGYGADDGTAHKSRRRRAREMRWGYPRMVHQGHRSCDAGTIGHEQAEIQVHPPERRTRQSRDIQGSILRRGPRRREAALRDRRREGELRMGTSPRKSSMTLIRRFGEI